MAVFVLLLIAAGAATQNMNQDYVVANPRTSGQLARFRGEFFEISGPQTRSKYSEVWWSSQTTSLPDHIVKRFDGKTMAITGYEVDIMRTDPDGTNVSVPCYEQYNHHFSAFMHGKAVEQDPSISLIGAHGGKLPGWKKSSQRVQAPMAGLCTIAGLWLNPSNGITVNISTAAHISASSYRCGQCDHIYDPAKDGNGLAFERLPDSWVCPVCGAPKSAYKKMQLLDGEPRWGHKHLGNTSTAFNASCIGDRGWHQGYGEVTAPTADVPQGGATLRARDDLSVHATANFSTSPAEGAPACSTLSWSDGNTWYKLGFTPGPIVPSVQVFSEGNGNEHRKSFHGYAAGYAQLIQSPVAFQNMPMIINTNKRLTGEVGDGHISTLVPRRSLAPKGADYSGILECPCTSRKVKIVDKYTGQSSACPAVQIEGTSVPSYANTEHECLAAAQQFCKTIASNSTISSSDAPPGCSYHMSSEGCMVLFNSNPDSSAPCAPASLPAQRCICRDPASLGGVIAGQTFNRGVCAPYPTSELLTTNNGICNISAYEGGLHCCGGGSLLLDADQHVPAQPDSWHLRYRFYFEDYRNHSNLYRVWWSTEATNNEYDVPKSTADCQDPNTDPEMCVHQIVSKFQGKDMLSTGSGCMAQASTGACIDTHRIADKYNGYFKLMYAAAHCHAPSCMSLELWDTDRNLLLCRNDAVYGNGTDPMNERGYLVGIPPCVWGDDQDFERPPVLHLDSNLTTIKRSNNTNGHWGVMALWQMRAAYL